MFLQDLYTDADEALRRAAILEANLSKAHYGIGLAAIILGNNTVVLIQNEKLMELDWIVARKLMEHQERNGFTPGMSLLVYSRQT